MQTLSLGCGQKKHPGSIGIDVNSDSHADIIHNLNVFPYPFEEDTFDAVIAENIMEHLDDIVLVMEELHRITKANGVIHITTPHFTSMDAYSDPTHKHYFSMRSFDYFTGDFNQFAYYSKARFFKRKVEVHFWSLPRLGNIKPQHWFGAHLLSKHMPSVYERFFAYLFPAQYLRFELIVIK
jgi:SAM-dependent methyltransferase